MAVLSVPPLDDAGIVDPGLGVHGRAPSEGEGVRVWYPELRLGTPHATGSYSMTSGSFALMLADRRRFEEPEVDLTCTLVIHVC